jgi:hypothetical protein
MANLIDMDSWKKLLKMKGYNWYKRQLDTYKMEGMCMLCGRYEQVWPLSGVIRVCDKCASKGINANAYMKYRRPVNLWGEKCQVCGRMTFRPYVIYDGRVCIKCTWHKLGHQRKVLKVDGERV